MSPATCYNMALGALVAFLVEAFGGFALLFTGWANGWPFGWTIHVVWSAGMAALLFVMLMTFTVGVAAVVAADRPERRTGRGFGWTTFARWLAAAWFVARSP